MTEKAIQKLRKELAAYKGDRYGKRHESRNRKRFGTAVPVGAGVCQAVVEGGDFSGCMQAVTRAIKGNAISDIDAYCAAAAYYFPGCKVSMTLSISMSGDINPGDAVSEPGSQPPRKAQGDFR